MVSKNIKVFLTAIVITLAASGLALAQDSVALSVAPSALRAFEMGGIAEGQKLKIEGIVINHNEQSFTVRDAKGSETVVLVTNQTVIKKKRRGWIYVPGTAGADEIRCGLKLKVKGLGNSDGQLVAKNITLYPDPEPTKQSDRIDLFDEQAGSTQVPAEARLNQAQENAPLLWRIPISQHCGKCSHVCSERCATNSCPGDGGSN